MVIKSFFETLPGVQFRLEIADSLFQLLDKNRSLRGQLTHGIAQKVDEFCQILGVPGKASIQISPLELTRTSGEQFFRLSKDERQLHYPDELLRWVYASVMGSLHSSGKSLSQILQWLESATHESMDGTGVQELVVEFFQLACLEVIEAQPAILIEEAQVETYRAALSHYGCSSAGDQRWPPPPNWLFPVYKTVVGLGISFANIPNVADQICTKIECSPEDAAEALAASLAPQTQEIRISEDYLRTMKTLVAGEGGDLFPFMRDGLFVELGVTCPRLHFVLDESIKPGSFAISVNHIPGLPVPGLQREQILVNDRSEVFRQQGIEVEEALNPATMHPAAIIDARYKEKLENEGWTTWSHEGYLILCLAATLRKNLWRMTNRDTVKDGLDKLEQAFPNLVTTTLAKYPIETVTRIERGLLAEEISVRNLRQVLERMLDYPFSSSDRTRFLVLDDRPMTPGSWGALKPGSFEHMLSFVRAGFKDLISHKMSRSTSTIVVYLLDSEIEQMALEWKYEGINDGSIADASSKEEVAKKIIQAVRKELSFLPPTAQTPAILTTVEARPFIREILQLELPRIPVICYDELLQDMNIQPVARISLR